MKNTIITLFFSLILNFSFAQSIKETKVETDINRVTVFITGGEIERQANVNLRQGRNKLVFTHISTVADQKSIQFNADQSYDLVSVSTEIDYLSAVVNNPRINELRDSVTYINEEVQDLQNEKAGFQAEKDLLIKNNSIKGEQQNLSVDELKSMAEYYRTRITEINKTITKYNKDIQELNAKKYRYQNQLTELNYHETVKSNQIIVIVDADEDKSMNVTLKYVVSNCGWQANYDISATNVKDQVNLKYKAKVFNNTGNDWNDIDMVLSTSDPNLSASAPILSPWYLNYSSLSANDYSDGKNYVVPTNSSYTQYYDNASAPQMNQNLDGVVDGSFGWDFGNGIQFTSAREAGTGVSFTTIQVSQLSTEFDIAKKYTIPSDSKPYLVEIKEHSLDASFTHKAVPKLDKDAFLLANIVGWEKLELVPGPTNVYFADTYVGQSYINTQNVGDTLRLSFGRDKKVLVDRKLLEEFSDKKVIGNNRKDMYTYEITIKNLRDIEVNLSLFDQIPISQDSDISVSVEEISGATYDETTGKLKWIVNLAPGATAKYKISFEIKYPENKKIKVQQFRTISCPSF